MAQITLDEIRRTGERLQAEFSALIRALPVQPPTAAAIARFLGLKGPLCQRVVSSSRHRGDPAELVGRFPGVDGLRQFTAAAEAQGCERPYIESAANAVDEFAALVHRAGGSQRRLIGAMQRLAEASADCHATAQEVVLRDRQAAFDSNAQIAGCWADATLAMTIIGRSVGRPDELEAFAIGGKLGYVQESAGIRMTARFRSPEGEGGGRPAESIDDTASGLAAAFSTPEVPSVRRSCEDGLLLQIFDPERVCGEALHLFTGPFRVREMTHPRLLDEPVYNDVTGISIPSKRLIKDLFVERELAMACLPTAGNYVLGNEGVLRGLPSDRWYDRIPGMPALQVLGQGVAHAGCEAHPRHIELARRMFETADRDPGRFLLYRCLVDYPVWQTQYVVTLEFERSSDAQTAS
jgi:hypothetical protein